MNRSCNKLKRKLYIILIHILTNISHLSLFTIVSSDRTISYFKLHRGLIKCYCFKHICFVKTVKTVKSTQFCTSSKSSCPFTICTGHVLCTVPDIQGALGIAYYLRSRYLPCLILEEQAFLKSRTPLYERFQMTHLTERITKGLIWLRAR